jgi:hypothetical protein
MRRVLYLSAMITFMFVADSLAQNMKAGKNAGPVEFRQYESYFEKNDSGLKGETSYLVFANQAQFDKVFGTAATAQNDFLPSDVFKSRIVVTAIKRGSLRHYAGVKVTAQNGKLFVWYDAQDDAPNSATFSTPLILAVDKGKYNEVVFMENGKKAGTAKLKKR